MSETQSRFVTSSPFFVLSRYTATRRTPNGLRAIAQAELAGKAGCTEQYISVIERGINFPAYNLLIRLLHILGISADAVLCDVINHSAEQRASELSAIASKKEHNHYC